MLARLRSTGITFMGRSNRFVGLLGAVAANLTTDRRGMYANLFRDACLAFSGAQTGLNLVTLALSQPPVSG